MYSRTLKVSSPNRKRVVINVDRNGSDVIITTKKLDVLSDVKNAPFINNGQVKIVCKPKDYGTMIKTLTHFFEYLYLKELSNDSTHTGNETGVKSGRGATASAKGNLEKTEGKGKASSLRDSSRGDKPTKTSQGKQGAEIDVAEDND